MICSKTGYWISFFLPSACCVSEFFPGMKPIYAIIAGKIRRNIPSQNIKFLLLQAGPQCGILLLYKFYNRRSYGAVYGRLLAMMLSSKPLCDYDILTWVPVSRRRRWLRGYDQVELIARSAGQELNTPAIAVLKKIKHTKPQSRLPDYARRKANVMGVFSVSDPALIAGKRILLLDDIITTGATVSECARVLLTAGAKEVHCAAVAALNKDKHR